MELIQAQLDIFQELVNIVKDDFTLIYSFKLKHLVEEKISLKDFYRIVENISYLKDFENLHSMVKNLTVQEKKEHIQPLIFNLISKLISEMNKDLRDPKSLAPYLLGIFSNTDDLNDDLILSVNTNLKDFPDLGLIIDTITKDIETFKIFMRDCIKIEEFFNALLDFLKTSYSVDKFFNEIIKYKSKNTLKDIKELIATSNEANFGDKLKQMAEDLPDSYNIDDRYINNIKTLNYKLDVKIVSSNSKLNCYISGMNVKMSQVLKELPFLDKISQVSITSSSDIHIDCSLANSLWHGKDVHLKAKNLIVRDHVEWDLSGLKNQYKYHEKAVTDDKLNGLDGQKGFDGENSGHLKLDIEEEIKNLDVWTVKLNGGTGGDGQNGGDGRKSGLTEGGMGFDKFRDKFCLKDVSHTDLKNLVQNIKEFGKIIEFWDINGAESFENFSLGHPLNFYVHVQNEKREEIIFSLYSQGKGFMKPFGRLGSLIIPKYKYYLLYKCNKDIGGRPGVGGLGGLGGNEGRMSCNFDIPNVESKTGQNGSNGKCGDYASFEKKLDFGYIFKGSQEYTYFGNESCRYLDIFYEELKTSDKEEKHNIKCKLRKGLIFDNYLAEIKDISTLTSDREEHSRALRKTTLRANTVYNRYLSETGSNMKAINNRKYATKIKKTYTKSKAIYLSQNLKKTLVSDQNDTIANIHDVLEAYSLENPTNVHQTAIEILKRDLPSVELNLDQIKVVYQILDNIETDGVDSFKVLQKYKFSILQEINRETHDLYKRHSWPLKTIFPDESKQHQCSLNNNLVNEIMLYFDNGKSVQNYLEIFPTLKVPSGLNLNDLYRNENFLDMVALETGSNLCLYEHKRKTNFDSNSNMIFQSSTVFLDKHDFEISNLVFNFSKYFEDQSKINEKHVFGRNISDVELFQRALKLIKGTQDDEYTVFLLKHDSKSHCYNKSKTYGNSDKQIVFLEYIGLNDYALLDIDFSTIFEDAVLKNNVKKKYFDCYAGNEEFMKNYFTFKYDLNTDPYSYSKEQAEKLDTIEKNLSENNQDSSSIQSLRETIKAYKLKNNSKCDTETIARYKKYVSHVSKDYLDLVSCSTGLDLIVFEIDPNETTNYSKIYSSDKEFIALKYVDGKYMPIKQRFSELVKCSYEKLPESFAMTSNLVSFQDSKNFLEKLFKDFTLDELNVRIKKIKHKHNLEVKIEKEAFKTDHISNELFKYLELVSTITQRNIFVYKFFSASKQFTRMSTHFTGVNNVCVFLELHDGEEPAKKVLSFLNIDMKLLKQNCFQMSTNSEEMKSVKWAKIVESLNSELKSDTHSQKLLSSSINKFALQNKVSFVIFKEIEDENLTQIYCSKPIKTVFPNIVLLINKTGVEVSKIHLDSIWLDNHRKKNEEFFQKIIDYSMLCLNRTEHEDLLNQCEKNDHQINVKKAINKESIAQAETIMQKMSLKISTAALKNLHRFPLGLIVLSKIINDKVLDNYAIPLIEIVSKDFEKYKILPFICSNYPKETWLTEIYKNSQELKDDLASFFPDCNLENLSHYNLLTRSILIKISADGVHINSKVICLLSNLACDTSICFLQWIILATPQSAWLKELFIFGIENVLRHQIYFKESFSKLLSEIISKSDEILYIFLEKMHNEKIKYQECDFVEKITYQECDSIIYLLTKVNLDENLLTNLSGSNLLGWFELLVQNIDFHADFDTSEIVKFIMHVRHSKSTYVASKLLKVIKSFKYEYKTLKINVEYIKLYPIIYFEEWHLRRKDLTQIYEEKWKLENTVIDFLKTIELNAIQLEKLLEIDNDEIRKFSWKKYSFTIFEDIKDYLIDKDTEMFSNIWRYAMEIDCEDKVKDFWQKLSDNEVNKQNVFPEIIELTSRSKVPEIFDYLNIPQVDSCQKQLKSALKALESTKPYIVGILASRLRYDGLHLSITELCFALQSFRHSNLYKLIPTKPQSQWTYEILITDIEHHIRQSLTAKRKESIRQHMHKVRSKEILIDLCEKIRNYDADVRINLDNVEGTLELLSNTNEELDDPSSQNVLILKELNAFYWKYSLAEEEWKKKLRLKKTWIEYSKMSYFANSLDLFADPEKLKKVMLFLKRKNAKKSQIFKIISSNIDEDKDYLAEFKEEVIVEDQRNASEIIRTIKRSASKDLQLFFQFVVSLIESFYNKKEKNTFGDRSCDIKRITIKNVGSSDIDELIKKFARNEYQQLKINFVDPKKAELMIYKDVQDVLHQKLSKHRSIKEENRGFFEMLIIQVIIVHDVLKHIDNTIGSFNLRNNQIIAILLTVLKEKNTFLQLASGEGKSLTIACSSIMRHLLYGEVIHVVSSSAILAKRDAEQFELMYEKFGIRSGHNCTENKEDRKIMYSISNVVYGFLGQFQYDYLLESFYGNKHFQESLENGKTTVFIDEVDNILLDNGNNMLYLSRDLPQFDKLEAVFIEIWQLTQKSLSIDKICALVEIGLSRRITREHLEILQCVENLTTAGITDDAGKINNAENASNIPNLNTDLKNAILVQVKLPKSIHDFALKHLKIWSESARAAIELKENCDYVVDYHSTREQQDNHQNIIIIAKDTGTDQVGAEWDEGLHQFLQLKHKLCISLLNLKSVFISNITYSKLYKNQIGLTGTLGSQAERKFLSETYNADCVVIPSFKHNLFAQNEPILCDDDCNWKENVKNVVTDIYLNLKRPLLIICESIEEVEDLHKVLKKDFNDSEMLNVIKRSKDCENFENGLVLDKEVIILSTNLSGRGSDIKISDILNERGGLHVCVTCLPSNMRVELQAFRRAARKGQKGSGGLIFKNPYSKDYNGSVYDLLRKRDVENEFRLLEIQSYYKRRIVPEEKCLKLFKTGFDKIVANTEVNSEIFIHYCLNQWTFKLDSISMDIYDKNLENEIESFNGTLENSIKEIIDEKYDKNNFDLICFINLAKSYAKKPKQFERSHKILDYIIKLQPDFSESAHFYKAFVFARQNDWSNKKALDSQCYKAFIEELHKALMLLTDRRNTLLDYVDIIEGKQTNLESYNDYFFQKMVHYSLYTFVEFLIKKFLNPVKVSIFSPLDDDENSKNEILKVLKQDVFSKITTKCGKFSYFTVPTDWKEKFKKCNFPSSDNEKIKQILYGSQNQIKKFKQPTWTLKKITDIDEYDQNQILITNGFCEFIELSEKEYGKKYYVNLGAIGLMFSLKLAVSVATNHLPKAPKNEIQAIAKNKENSWESYINDKFDGFIDALDKRMFDTTKIKKIQEFLGGKCTISSEDQSSFSITENLKRVEQTLTNEVDGNVLESIAKIIDDYDDLLAEGE